MRTLLAVGVVAAIVAGFSLFTILLPRWRTGEEKTPLVRGVVVAAPGQRATGPVVFHVSLFSGRPQRVPPGDALVDDDAPAPEFGRGQGRRSYRFQLAAGPADGPTFFVRAAIELTTFEEFCADAVLPPVRLVDDEWVATRTGRPLRPLRLEPTRPCR
ncbi:MAG: hypothetical protein ICV64_11315 [Thermoleophilia bacterium]|nr:hypothetical protein [Thermoleophilia bacterium]